MKVKRLFLPNSYPSNEFVEEIMDVTFNSKKFLSIKITPMRNVVDIKPFCTNKDRINASTVRR